MPVRSLPAAQCTSTGPWVFAAIVTMPAIVSAPAVSSLR